MGGAGQGVAGGSRRGEQRRAERPERRPWLDMEVVGRGLDRFRDAYSGAADRIMALAGAANHRTTGRTLRIRGRSGSASSALYFL